MVSSLNANSNVNAVQLFSAANAFKSSMTSPIKPTGAPIPEVGEGIDINDDSLLKTKDIQEIRNYAKMMGEENLSEDDIKYGLSYGRSVIVEYSA